MTCSVIYPPTLDWPWLIQRPQQLMRQFARHGYPTYFCNLTQTPGRAPEPVAPNLWVIHDHEAFVAGGLPGGARLVWCSWPKLHDTLDRYRPTAVVFDAVDDFPEWRPYEGPMLRRADAVVTTARSLFERLSGLHSRVVLVPNGWDKDLARGPLLPRPADLPPSPVAGFVGAWAPWVDGRLLEEVAARLPRWQFVIIGPLHGRRPARGRNIHHLGHRAHGELGRYLRHLDVGLIPFQITPVTRAANPVKLWEYLGVGLPVVSTPLPEVLPLGEHVRFASDPDGFARAIEAAWQTDTPERRQARRQVATQNSWVARFARIQAELADLLDGGP
ncbi:glycosyltransferase family protein [Symbiobacterium thermophilum]|uniref:Glycosyl transferase family 1 n=1 Tax=Symbiobacterium thermophilum TaxID=2734 RepID=A0A953LFC3_SYMTR|nr:glycosyltransferase [Symbiobacterium thermophilum]MBY6275093.1 glycosyl transferase family 1 [Symbiobacterium thermophilum]